MANIHINIGSNQNRCQNLSQAITALKTHFTQVCCSPVFESRAYGFTGDDFYNIGVNASTNMSVQNVINTLHNIEKNQGRDRNSAKFSSRIIDLDLIFYDDIIDKNLNIPRADIKQYNFVLLPYLALNPEAEYYQNLSATMDTLKSYNINILK